ncbi:hypothetical protein FEM48_Zijuj09G0132600 [Ziziphus jujuba var. spinosa]|uniref:Leucine-rich repeat-containing N-terminal plant-type domain-containing protein n=1 Tax=Ziziphus jujuba var. spinosa TaxID=714518 RepID=A0A978UT78_ZIZJJ|nr:hypothetical protein FEM48_Zijuj09G0132600 [Ziziphus jujuba var. spinosa]
MEFSVTCSNQCIAKPKPLYICTQHLSPKAGYGSRCHSQSNTAGHGNALHALRSRFSDPTNVLQSWDPTLVNPCTWFHVTCDSNSHVIRLELYRNEISGKIPKELGKLKNLISMDLYDNKFEGEIPKSLNKLKSLRFLRLNNNKLTGSIPRGLTKLSNLKVFDVSNNDLCGTIPVEGPFATFPMERYHFYTCLS